MTPTKPSSREAVPKLLPREEAEALLDEALAGRRLPVETVAAREAVGRRLASPALSALDLPPFDKSAVDGYALPPGEAPEGYLVRGTVAAGGEPPSVLGAGEAVRVMTGAPVPPGASEVVMQEHTRLEDGRLRVLRRGPANVCLRGEDVRAGDEVLPAGRLLGPLDAANLVSCGLDRVEVFRRLRVAVLSTGDELVDDPARLGPGRIMDCNGPLLAGLAARHGMETVSREAAADSARPLREALSRALERADMVLISGGVSVGEFDLVPETLDALGLRRVFKGLLVKPGRPTALAMAPDGKLVFGLPGNPAAVYLIFHLFVLRAAARLAGAPPASRFLSLPMARDFRRGSADREEFVPARLTGEGRVEALDCHGPAHLLSLTEAEGYLVVPPGVRELQGGVPALFMPLARLP